MKRTLTALALVGSMALLVGACGTDGEATRPSVSLPTALPTPTRTAVDARASAVAQHLEARRHGDARADP